MFSGSNILTISFVYHINSEADSRTSLQISQVKPSSYMLQISQVFEQIGNLWYKADIAEVNVTTICVF